MLNNIFLDAEFEKKITEMTIEAIEANDIILDKFADLCYNIIIN